MKLSLLTFSVTGEVSAGTMDAALLAKLAADNGISELDMFGGEIAAYGEDALREAMEKSSVRCGCVIVNVSLLAGAGGREQILRDALALAGRMGAEMLMVVPATGAPGESEALQRFNRAEKLELAVTLYTDAVRLAGEYGVTASFEDTPNRDLPLSAPKDCLELLHRVPGLGFVFDTANFLVAEPECGLFEAWELLKSRVVRVHLKDVVIGNFDTGEMLCDGRMMRAVPTGSGVVPVEELAEKIAAGGFKGCASVEYFASPEVHGAEHGKYLSVYTRNIRSALEGKREKAPTARIRGLDKPVSRIFFGTAIGPMAGGRDAFGLLDSALACGINAFDCARGYGLAERALGRWIKERNNRDRVVILTKCGNCAPDGSVCVNRQVIELELETSLQELDTDYIDIYLLHRDDPNTPVSEFIDTLNEAKRQGKIRVFGVSNWTAKRIREANDYAAANGIEGFSVSSPNFGLARQICDPWGGGCVTVSGPENRAEREWYAGNKMPVIAYSSLGRGFFSGRFKAFDYEAAARVLDGAAKKGYLCPENMRRLRNAEKLALRDGCSVSQIAMRYIFGSAMNVFAIVSTENPVRIYENAAAALSPLSREDAALLEADGE